MSFYISLLHLYCTVQFLFPCYYCNNSQVYLRLNFSCWGIGDQNSAEECRWHPVSTLLYPFWKYLLKSHFLSEPPSLLLPCDQLRHLYLILLISSFNEKYSWIGYSLNEYLENGYYCCQFCYTGAEILLSAYDHQCILLKIFGIHLFSFPISNICNFVKYHVTVSPIFLTFSINSFCSHAQFTQNAHY